MTGEQKLGRCRTCMILSSSLAVASVVLLAISAASFSASGSLLMSSLSMLGIGFFGGLTAMHLVVRRKRSLVMKRLAQRVRNPS